MIVKAVIKTGWHIYANPTGVAELSPTKLEVDAASRNVVTLKGTEYPAGVQKVLASSGKEKVGLYEKDIEIKAHSRWRMTRNRASMGSCSG